MSSDEEAETVEVLYDYSYEDESGIVTINVGETYTLLEKTNREWWRVIRPEDTESFFVPAQYVQIIARRDQDGLYANQETRPRRKHVDEDDSDTPPSNNSRRGSSEGGGGKRPTTLVDHRIIPREEVLYANLEEYRNDARIAAADNNDVAQPVPTEYANLPMAGPGESGLPPQSHIVDGDGGRRLVEYLPWFIYNENGPDRPYYINIDTGEKTFKPPRHKNQKIAEKLSPTLPKVIFENPSDSPREATPLSEYDEVREEGKLFYVHKKTKDKFEKSNNESGSQYFFNVKSGESFWELPSFNSPRFHNGDFMDENRNPRSSQSLRYSKAKSMCEPMDYLKGEHGGLKAHTLPPSFSYGSRLSTNVESDNYDSDKSRPASPALDRVDERSQSSHQHKPRPTSPTIRIDDPLNGILNKAKIAEVGKKVKKAWSQSYVVLQGSNLIFYKDQKASMNRPGSPHGKPEFIISLLGAKVDFNCDKKNLSSKKNVITLTANSNTQFLLQSEEEAVARKWFFRLKVAANDIQEEEKKQQAGAPSMQRSQSVDEAHPGGASGLQRNPSMNSTYFKIRTKLLGLINRRPTQEELFKRGIIKDVVFGSNLEELCRKEHNTVPNFVKKCIAAVEKKGLDHDGLYRISGNLAEIQKLRYKVDKEESYNLDDEDLDVHVLTGSLKLFFRELKEPLFPFKLFHGFTGAINKEKNKDRLRAFKDLMAELPRCHRETMNMLFHHLRKVIDMCQQNRMQTQNVAIVFGPTLMWSDNETCGMAVMTIIQSRVVEYMLLEYDELFR